MIPIDDRGFTLGDGLFETILWEEGELVWWDEHMARLERGCDGLGLPRPNVDSLRAKAVAEADGLTRAAIRITLTAGSGGRGLDRPAVLHPQVVVSAASIAVPTAPARLLTSTIRRNEGSPASRLKTLSYLDNVLARREALTGGADEAVMLNNRGEVACAAAANIFWVKGDRLFTPALDCGVLDGIARAKLVAALPVMEVHQDADSLRSADAVFLTNSLMGVRRVSHLDGQPVGDHERVQQSEQVMVLERRGRR